MHELGWFTCPSAFGATSRPAPAYPCAHSCIFGPCGSHYESMKKGGQNQGQPQAGRPLGRPTQWWRSSIRASAQGAHGTPSAQFYQFHSEFLLPLLSLLLFLPKFIRKKKKKISLFCIFICISCLPSSLHKNVFVVVLLPLKNGFVVRHRPQEWFCGVLSPTRMIFVRGNHAPQGLLTLGQLTWFLLTLT